MIKFDRIVNEVIEKINAGEDNFVVDAWEIKRFGNEIVASTGGEKDIFLCMSKGIESSKFDIQLSGPYINIAVESAMYSESVERALCVLRSDVHTEMYQQYDCRHAPVSLADVDKVVRDCDIAAKLITSTIEDLFGVKTLA